MGLTRAANGVGTMPTRQAVGENGHIPLEKSRGLM
jgi:hypothetical protein